MKKINGIMPMFFSSETSKVKAQHLVELLLFFPFFIGIIGILGEITYAFNMQSEFNSALQRAAAVVSFEQKGANVNIDLINEKIKNNTTAILNARRVPYSNQITTKIAEMGNFYLITANYSYKCVFLPAASIFPVLPQRYNFNSSILINKSYFEPNTYNIPNSELKEPFKEKIKKGEEAITTAAKQILNEKTDEWRTEHIKMWDEYVQESLLMLDNDDDE